MPVQASHVLNSRILSISTITSLPHCLDSARKATSEQAKVGKLDHFIAPILALWPSFALFFCSRS